VVPELYPPPQKTVVPITPQFELAVSRGNGTAAVDQAERPGGEDENFA
jgi:hypothetical protein